MKIISGRIPGKTYKVHSIKDSHGRFTNGSCYLVDRNFNKERFIVGNKIGIEDMIMMVDLSTWELWKLFVWSLFGVKEHKIQ